MTPAFRASHFLWSKMKRLCYIEEAVKDLHEKEVNFIETVERMIDQLDDDEIKMLVE